MIDLRLGDCLDVLKTLPSGSVHAVVTDPPYGMKWNTNSKRFSGGKQGVDRYLKSGRDDWGPIVGDNRLFDPTPWLAFPKVVLWGANHFAGRLPVGTTLVWIKKADHLFGTFLSDCEIGWLKGGHGVYAFRKQFPPSSRMAESGGRVAHSNQKPVALMRWCLERLKLKPGDTVFDPYMGSGTCGVAAVEMGLNFIGCEIDPRYFAIAERRIREAQAATPLLNSTHTD